MPSPEQREFATLLLRKAGSDVEVQVPEVVVEARWPTPWSAEFRYDDPPVPDDMDRDASLRSAEQALAWARGVLDRGE